MDFSNYILCCFCSWDSSDSSSFWIALTAIFTGIIAIFTGIAAFGALIGLRWHAWINAHEIFTQKEFVGHRKIVYGLKNMNFANWDSNQMESAKFVCRKMDELAHLAEYLGEKKMLKVWNDPFAKLWGILNDFVVNERSPENANWPNKWIAFQNMGINAAKWILTHPNV